MIKNTIRIIRCYKDEVEDYECTERHVAFAYRLDQSLFNYIRYKI